MTTTIELTDAQLALVRREMMRSAAKDLQHASSELESLGTVSPWPAGTKSTDAQNAVTIAREGLDLVDRLGWPCDETREEWEARLAAVVAS